MLRLCLLIPLMLPLSNCATVAVGSAVVGTTVTATKVAVKGTVGAGKLAYRGTRAAVRGTRRLVRRDEAVSPSIQDDYESLPDPE